MVVGKSIIFCKFLKYSFDNNIISCCPPEKSPNNIRPKLLRRPQQIQSWVKEWPRGKMKIFVSIGPGKISSEQLRKDEKIKSFGHSRAPKKMPPFDHFPRPGKIDPYFHTTQLEI